jgi:hypothetical protein
MVPGQTFVVISQCSYNLLAVSLPYFQLKSLQQKSVNMTSCKTSCQSPSDIFDQLQNKLPVTFRHICQWAARRLWPETIEYVIILEILKEGEGCMKTAKGELFGFTV